MTQKDGTRKLVILCRRSTHRLYERFLEYYRRHYPQPSSAAYIEWDAEYGDIKYLPIMKSILLYGIKTNHYH